MECSQDFYKYVLLMYVHRLYVDLACQRYIYIPKIAILIFFGMSWSVTFRYILFHLYIFIAIRCTKVIVNCYILWSFGNYSRFGIPIVSREIWQPRCRGENILIYPNAECRKNTENVEYI
jgi:hypothetical protein